MLCCSISLGRVELRNKVIKSPEVLEVLHELADINEYLHSLYECRYAAFFKKLAIVEDLFRHDRLLSVHCRFYIREMRIIAYAQLLESYRSLTLQSMAESFGVSVEYIDKELSRFIAAGKLNCKIDKVHNIVETNRPDSKNAQYQSAIKKGGCFAEPHTKTEPRDKHLKVSTKGCFVELTGAALCLLQAVCTHGMYSNSEMYLQFLSFSCSFSCSWS